MYLRAWPPLYSGWPLLNGFFSSKQIFEHKETIISIAPLAAAQLWYSTIYSK